MKKMRVGATASSLKGPGLIFSMALYFYFLAGRIQDVPISGQLGPAFWPKTILILLMVSCGIKAVETILEKGRKTGVSYGSSQPKDLNIVRLIAMIACIMGIVWAMEILGFLLATFLFFLVFTRIAGWRRIASLLITSSLGTVGVLYLFVKVVYLPLPKGQWFFNDLTIFLYRLLAII